MNDKHTLINGLETGAEKKTPLFFLLLFQVQQHRKENTQHTPNDQGSN